MRQRGFITLPLMAWAAIGAAAIILALGIALKVQSSRLDAVQQEYATFKADVKAKGELAEQERIRKEAEYANSIRSAVSSRNLALKRLRDGSGKRQTSLSPTPAAGGDLLCFDVQRFDAALEKFRAGVEGIASRGSEAQIDAKSLLDAWPR